MITQHIGRAFLLEFQLTAVCGQPAEKSKIRLPVVAKIDLRKASGRYGALSLTLRVFDIQLRLLDGKVSLDSRAPIPCVTGCTTELLYNSLFTAL